LNELRKLLQDKEFTIQELEKVKPIVEQEGIMIKYKEVINPSEQHQKLQHELDTINFMVSKVTKEINKIQGERQDIQTMNFNLANEISKMRATFSSPLNLPSGAIKLNDDEDLNNSCMGFMNRSSGDTDGSDIPEDMPEKVHLNTKEYHNGGKNIPISLSVPKLDLTKAKKIQEINAKKTQQTGPLPGVDQKTLDKMKAIELDTEGNKKLLSREMMGSKGLTDELTHGVDQNQFLMSQNDVLIKSNKRYEEKWQKIFYTLEFYKEFYHKYIDLITNKSQLNKPHSNAPFSRRLEKLEKLREKFNMDITESNPDQLIKGLKKIDEENGRLINVSILEASDDDNGVVTTKRDHKNGEGRHIELTKDQCKIYLLNLAKDLHLTTNINKTTVQQKFLKELENTKPGVKRVQRSNSNPLDYIDDRKNPVFDVSYKTKESKNMNSRKVVETQPDYDQHDDMGYQHHYQQDEEEEKYHEGSNKPNAYNTISSKEIISPIPLKQRPSLIRSDPKKKFEEDLSFSVDPDEMAKNKMNEVSFISNNDIF